MRIAYVGNFRPEHSTECHYARAFESLGHEVLRLQEDDMPSWNDAGIGITTPEFELLLYTRTWDAVPADWFAAVARFGVPTVGLHLDVFMGIDRGEQVAQQVMFHLDHLFQPDGDAIEWFRARQVNAHWLRPGVVADECLDAAPFTPEECPWEVAFVGSREYHAEWPHRPALIDFLAETYGDRFIHVGGDGTPILGLQPGEALRNVNLNRFYATVPVIVGDSLGSDNPARKYWSDRFTETWGRGGFLIFPELDALRDEVGPYPSYRPGDPNWREALKLAIDNCLAHPDERASERARIAGVVRTRCTYSVRADELLTELGFGKMSVMVDEPPAVEPWFGTGIDAAAVTAGTAAPPGFTGLMTATGPDPRTTPGPPAPPRFLEGSSAGVPDGDPSNPASFAPPFAQPRPFGDLDVGEPADTRALAGFIPTMLDTVASEIAALGPLMTGDVLVVRLPKSRLGPEGLTIADALIELLDDGVGSMVVADDTDVVRVELHRSRALLLEGP